jgi:hypothetical protein
MFKTNLPYNFTLADWQSFNMAKKFLFISHFPVPEEKQKEKTVKDLQSVLHDMFYKQDIKEFENYQSLPSLELLYSMKECSEYDFIDLTRKAVLEILHNYCGVHSYAF